MSKSAVGFDRLEGRRAPSAAFINSFGTNTVRSYSVSPTNRAGERYLELPEGQVIALYEPDGLHYPMAYDEAQEAVTDGNTVEVEDARQFFEGDMVELPDSVADNAERFREVVNVDHDNNEVELDGDAFDLEEGDGLEVDPSRSFDAVQSDVNDSAEVEVEDAERFEEGDAVEIGTETGLTVDSVDTENDTITVDSNITVSEGDLVVSDPDGGYKVMQDGTRLGTLTRDFQNVAAETRRVGEVNTSVLVGLSPTARAALDGDIEFNDDI